MDRVLQYLIYGKPITTDGATGDYMPLVMTDHFNPDDAPHLYRQIPLRPVPADTEADSRAVALMSVVLPDHDPMLFLAQTLYQNARPDLPVFQYVRLEEQVFHQFNGELRPLLAVLPDNIPPYSVTHVPVSPLDVPMPTTRVLDEHMGMMQAVVDNFVGGQMETLISLVGAALSGRSLLLRGPATLEQKLTLIQTMMLLLPVYARQLLTFATTVRSLPGEQPALIFVDENGDTPPEILEGLETTNRWQFELAQPAPVDVPVESAYIAYLYDIWQDTGSIPDLMTQLRSMEILASELMYDVSVQEGLERLVARHRRDRAVMSGADIPSGEIIDALTDDAAPRGDMRFHYVERLLLEALEERDTIAAEVVAREIDTDPALDEQLSTVFEESLASQPDAVYVFMRTRLSERDDETAGRWLERLHQAAERSLEVAVSSSDTPTLVGWLQLISREPTRYQLQDVLHAGLMAALERVENDGELAENLLMLAVKRDPDSIDIFMQDETFINALEGNIAGALLSHEPAAVEALANESRELFLLAVGFAAENGFPSVTSGSVRILWEMYQNPTGGSLAARYRPRKLIETLVTEQGYVCLTDNALETLLTLLLAAGEDELFLQTMRNLNVADMPATALPDAMEQSGRTMNDLMALLNTLSGEDILVPAQMIAICAALLTDGNWDESLLPLAERLARTLKNNPDVQILTGTLWRMLETAATVRSEVMVRVATRQLLAELGDTAVEAQLVESLERMLKAIAWHPPAQAMLMQWWRTHTDDSSLVQLQKYDKALEGKRSLETLRSIVQTTIAMRRLMGSRSLDEFAQAINTTYAILQALSDAFPSTTRQSILIDRETIRETIDLGIEDLSPDQRQVLATNLKELAQLIARIADNRSKPSLLGPGADDLDRALFAGEQQPAGAIDIMKFLSGYLEGSHRPDEPDDTDA